MQLVHDRLWTKNKKIWNFNSWKLFVPELTLKEEHSVLPSEPRGPPGEVWSDAVDLLDIEKRSSVNLVSKTEDKTGVSRSSLLRYGGNYMHNLLKLSSEIDLTTIHLRISTCMLTYINLGPQVNKTRDLKFKD